MAKKNIGILVALAAGVGLVVFASKKAKATTGDVAQPADLPARYMAALAHVIESGGSFEEYHRILAEASAAGAFTPEQQISLLGRHPDASPEMKENAKLV
jgi:hypothetical protein